MLLKYAVPVFLYYQASLCETVPYNHFNRMGLLKGVALLESPFYFLAEQHTKRNNQLTNAPSPYQRPPKTTL
jgi:hypothetical protein